MRLALALALGDFDEGFIRHPALCVVPGNGFSGKRFGVEHQPIAGIAIMRNRDDIIAGLPSIFQIGPKQFRIE